MTNVTMPQLGESVSEGTILKWLKQPGDPVALDDSLCEIETEKVTAELPSPFAGVMGALLVEEGATVDVGTVLCTVEEGAAAAKPVVAAPVATKSPAWTGGPMSIPPDEGVGVPPVGTSLAGARPAREAVEHSPEHREHFYSPVVLRLANEHGVELSKLTGSGIGGRVTRKDVEAAISAAKVSAFAPPAPVPAPAVAPAAPARTAAAPGSYVAVPMTATRRTIAENLTRSMQEAPQAWTMVEADVTGLVRLRAAEKARFAEEEGVELTLLPYFTEAVCRTLHEFPMLNARWEDGELRQYHALDIGIAVASEHGLVVPVIHGAGDLNIAGLAKRISDVAQRAHERRLRVEDVSGGTFTVDNTGAFGSIVSKPIVNYPQVAIVTMERVVKRPVVRGADDAIAVRSIMNVCLSFDHRAMDGTEAGGFLAALKNRLEAIG